MAVGAANTHAELFHAHREQFGPHIAGLIEEGLATSPVEYSQSRLHQTDFQAAIKDWLQPGQFAVTPSTPTIAPARLDTTGDPQFNSPWSYAGLPTVTIPCGLVAGMPCGLQLIGRAGSDHELLAAAQWCEQQLEWDASPPPLMETSGI
jgi:Asp-tRNA(Asn)/Glu-tRNA(Gln) amidotransferase A subunit family amidase